MYFRIHIATLTDPVPAVFLAKTRCVVVKAALTIIALHWS